MPVNLVDHPAIPHCFGKQWFVSDVNELARLTALVLLGRVHHVARILEGAQRNVGATSVALKARLQHDLFPAAGVDTWHRDGLLFEVICWLVARMNASPSEFISDPHLKSTQQGADTIKVEFDITKRSLIRTTIYEYKCTDRARRRFKQEVLPAFSEYFSGVRDDQLTQTVIGLLLKIGLTDDEHLKVYDRIISERPLAFQAALTVTPSAFEARQCIKLFKDYGAIPVALEHRLGDTFPLADIRQWFDGFALAIWAEIEAIHV